MKKIFIENGVSNKETRQALITDENIQLLREVKDYDVIEGLFAIPKQEVLKYFGIDTNRLNRHICKYKNELETLGLEHLSGENYKEFKENYKEFVGPIGTTNKGYCEFKGDGIEHKPFRLGAASCTLFSEPAMLLLALTLTNCKVAEIYREALYKKENQDNDSYILKEQKEILNAISKSIIEGDAEKEENLKEKLVEIQKEQIELLRNSIKEAISIQELKEFIELKRQQSI